MSTDTLSRRTLLGGSAAGGLALATGGMSAGPAQAAAPPPFQFFAQPDMNFSVLTALGETGYGAGEAGEIIATINAINAGGASYQTFYDAFIDRGQTVAKLAEAQLAAGFKTSARSAFLRAAQYFSQALFFVLGTRTPGAEETVYRLMQRQWDAATRLFDRPAERVRIPYEDTTMPGYFFAAQGQGAGARAAPTVIVMNGSDAQFIDVYAFGAAAAVERGWNALVFEGPGQGSMLFERKIPFRPDWEAVITPVVDYLLRRPDVDPARIALTGWSEGGELVIRAAAFEKRLAAVCADPGCVSIWNAFPASIRGLFSSGASEQQVNAIWRKDVIPQLSAVDRFTLSKRAEIYGPQSSMPRGRDRCSAICGCWDKPS